MEDKDFEDFIKKKVEQNEKENPEKFKIADKGAMLVFVALSDFNDLIKDMREKSTHEMGMQFLVASLTATIMCHAKNLDEAYATIEKMKSTISKQEKEYHTQDDNI